MYLLYLDASGTPDLADSAQPTSSCLVSRYTKATGSALEKRVAGLKRLYQFPGVPLELHAKDICFVHQGTGRYPVFATMSREARRAEVMSLREKRLAGKEPKARQVARERYRATEATAPRVALDRGGRLLSDGQPACAKAALIIAGPVNTPRELPTGRMSMRSRMG